MGGGFRIFRLRGGPWRSFLFAERGESEEGTKERNIGDGTVFFILLYLIFLPCTNWSFESYGALRREGDGIPLATSTKTGF